MNQLVGKKAVIAGASVGIGSAIGRRFSREGCSLYLAGGQNLEALNETIETCRKSGIEVDGEGYDLSEMSNAAVLLNRAKSFLGTFDILVNCAGIRCYKPIEDITPDEIESLFHVNSMSAFYLSSLAAKHMLEQGKGQILNIGSTSGEAGVPLNSLYCATKGAMHLMTKALAAELGPEGIRVNALAPGTTLSEGTEERIKQNPGRARSLIQSIPLKRFGHLEEMTACAAFMVSDEADYMNGAIVPMDGGRLCQ